MLPINEDLTIMERSVPSSLHRASENPAADPAADADADTAVLAGPEPASANGPVKMSIPRNLSYVSDLLEKMHFSNESSALCATKEECDGSGPAAAAASNGPSGGHGGGDAGLAQGPCSTWAEMHAFGRPCDYIMMDSPASLPLLRRRAKSLPPPSVRAKQAAAASGTVTPNTRKRVRFADSLGLDLISVRHYSSSEEVSIPNRVLSQLRRGSASGSVPRFGYSQRIESRFLEPQFQQPGTTPDFLERVRSQKVSLESLVVTSELGLHGLIRVLNLHFEKFVSVRYSLNGWATQQEVVATYVPGSSDGHTDKFGFSINTPPFMEAGALIQFAVLFVSKDQQYWDNNGGANYVVRCHCLKLSPPRDYEDSWIHYI
ncbi:protein phosphatase 1 regulatory subunit 3D-like isoform X1 [Petromyzon marinus]|uniref:protein phosphatase 1 regulatory subunit 3D-like isoform X1 n=2 Tax=Petromyzon marinus TaxID=7757 RepID=UPI003F7187B6